MTLAVVALGVISARGQEAVAAAQPAGRILVAKVVGEAFAVDSAAMRFPLRSGSLVVEGQVVTTGAGSSVLLVLSNGATVMIGADAALGVEMFTQEPFSQSFKLSQALTEPTKSKTRLNLMRGEIISDIKKLNKGAGSEFSIKSPVGAAGIRGTTFRLSFLVDGNRATYGLAMAEGVILQSFGSRAREVLVPANKQVFLSGLGYDGNTGEVTGVPSVVELSDVPASTLASLHQLVQQMLDAVLNLSVPGTAADGPGVQNGVVAPGSTEGAQPQDAVPGAQPPVSASPQAQVPPTRVSATDGKDPL